jgi:hypothetical protein
MHSRRVIIVLLAACSSPSSNPPPAIDAANADGAVDVAVDADIDGAIDAGPTSSAPYRIMAPPKIAANSGVRNRVIVVGTQPNGTPALHDMVLSFDRPGAGTYSRSLVTLDHIGASSYFSACDSTTPGCLGPVTLTAALASAPTVPVASVAVEIVDPIDVNPAKPCLGGGDVLYLKGSDPIFNGETTITNATWTFDRAYPEILTVRVTPPGMTDSWSLSFDVRYYAPFHIPDVYENVQKAVVGAELERDRPAMNVKGFGNECTTITGRYEVIAYNVTSSGADTFTIAFEQQCNNSNTILVGCVHHQ